MSEVDSASRPVQGGLTDQQKRENVVDGYRTKHVRQPGLTFPTWDPHVRLDYVFLPTAFAGRLTSCEIVDGPEAVRASDHFPVLAQLDIAVP